MNIFHFSQIWDTKNFLISVLALEMVMVATFLLELFSQIVNVLFEPTSRLVVRFGYKKKRAIAVIKGPAI